MNVKPTVKEITDLHNGFRDSEFFDTARCEKHGTTRPCRHCSVEYDVIGGIDPFHVEDYMDLAEKCFGMTVREFAQHLKRTRDIFVNAGVLPLMTDERPGVVPLVRDSQVQGVVDTAMELADDPAEPTMAQNGPCSCGCSHEWKHVGNADQVSIEFGPGEFFVGPLSNGEGCEQGPSDRAKENASRGIDAMAEACCNTEAPEPEHRISTRLPFGTADQAWERPRFVTIVGRTYRIEWKANKDDVKLPDGTEGVGVIDNQNLVLKIWSGMSLQLQRETLLHEIMHGCLSTTQTPMSNLLAGRDRIDVVHFNFDEFYVEAIDAVLLATLRSNPQVTGWLLAHVDGSDIVTTTTFTTTYED